MRIAYVVTRADFVGGASVHVRELSAWMRDQGHEAKVFLGGEGQVTRKLEEAGVPHHSLNHLQREISPVQDWKAAHELTQALHEFKPDIVSTHTAKAGFLGSYAAHKLEIPVLYTPHGLAIGDRISRLKGRIFTLAERRAAPWRSGVVCVCEYEARLAMEKRIGRPELFHVIHNGVRDVEGSQRARKDSDAPIVATIARFEPPKDYPTLLRALSELKDLPWRLRCVGDGPGEDDARALVRELGIEDRVEFAGYCPDPTKQLADANAFVLSSRSEGFPRSVLEAMRSGLPVVASDVGGVAEAVRADEVGFVVPPADPHALAQALAKVLQDPDERRRLGEGARQAYERWFTLDRMLDCTFRLYETILRG